MKPTKILKEPYYVESIDVIGRRRKKIKIDTDAGSFMFDELADLIGISHDTLRTRLSRDWKSMNALSPSRINCSMDIWKKEHGNEEWRQLSDKPRDHNLAMIRP